MKIDIYPQINLQGLNPQQAFARISDHVNQLTDIVVQLNNKVEDLSFRLAEMERQNRLLQSQLQQRR